MNQINEQDAGLDFCQGCADERARPKDFKQTLPYGWKVGDPIPPNVTVHGTPREIAAGQAPFRFMYSGKKRIHEV